MIGLKYLVNKKEINQFNNQGYLVLRGVLTEKEMQSIDPVFDHFISGKEQKKMKKDFRNNKGQKLLKIAKKIIRN